MYFWYPRTVGLERRRGNCNSNDQRRRRPGRRTHGRHIVERAVVAHLVQHEHMLLVGRQRMYGHAARLHREVGRRL